MTQWQPRVVVERSPAPFGRAGGRNHRLQEVVLARKPSQDKRTGDRTCDGSAEWYEHDVLVAPKS